MWILIEISIIVLGALLLFAFITRESKQLADLKSLINQRAPLSDDDLLAQHFESNEVDPDVPKVVRRVLARYFGLPTEKLLPDDDLTPFFVDLEMIYWIEDLETFFGITFADDDAEPLGCNIRSVSRFVSQKLSE